jgi:hypothetical protein
MPSCKIFSVLSIFSLSSPLILSIIESNDANLVYKVAKEFSIFLVKVKSGKIVAAKRSSTEPDSSTLLSEN